ncbi:MAG TPA: CBS domain-containing protein [Euryarchaeota archaeon]|nr:inosine 5'-monophosphate dehydrogenase [archaeon BMS3Abin16]GBE56371.1 inosine 5'-monophosphate dehydrogenase [archaeon BMS3Bbin16]HDH28307.1 CBS domain-containing protein [Euryarchaeota archaeon]
MADMTVLNLMNPDVTTAGPKETLSKVLGKMKKNGVHELPITDEQGRLVGFFSFDLLSKKKHIPLTTKIERLMVSPPKIGADTDLFEAAALMVETGFRALAVVRDGSVLTGIISRTDLIATVPDLKGVENVRAGDVMTEHPRLLTNSDPVESALTLMTELEEICAPVVDGQGRLAGGVLIDEVSGAVWREEKGTDIGDVTGENSKPEIEVGSFVTGVATAKKDHSIKKVCQQMSAACPYLCVVVDNSMQPIGVITQLDILKILVKPGGEKGVQVDVTGLKIDDPITRSSVTSKIDRFAKKIEGFNWINVYGLNLHIITYDRGAQNKWSLRARLASDKGVFTASSSGWDILRCADETFEELGRRILALKK